MPNGDNLKFGLQVELDGNDVVIKGLDGTAVSVAKLDDSVEKSSKSTKKATKANKELENSYKSLKGLIATVGLTALTVKLLNLTDGYNVLDQRIKTATKSSGDYQLVQQRIFELSQKNGTALQTTVELYQGLARSAPELGKSTQEVLLLSDSIQKLGVIGGSTNEQLNNGLLQFNQAMAGGVFRAEEFNSILDNVPELANRMAAGMGMTVGQLRLAVNEGDVLSKEVFEALLKQAPEIAKEFAEIPLSIDRAKQQFSNSLARKLGLLDDDIEATQAIAEAISGLASAVDAVDPRHIKATLQIMLGFAAARFVPSLFAAIAAQSAGMSAKMAAASLVAKGLKGSLAFLGGPAGVAIIAGTSLLALGANAETSEDKLNRLKTSTDSLTSSLEILSQVQAKSKIFDVTGEISELELQITEIENLIDRINGVRQLSSGAGFGFNAESIVNRATGGENLAKALAQLETATEELTRKQKVLADLQAIVAGEFKKTTAETDENTKVTELNAKQKEKLAKAQQSLLESLFPLQKEQREYVDSLKLLDTIYPKSQRNTAEYEEAIEALKRQYELLFPEIAKNIEAEKKRGEQLQKNLQSDADLIASLTDELALLQLTDAEREVEVNLRKLSADATDEQKAKVRELTGEILEESEARKQSNQAWETFVTEMVGAFADGADNIGDVFDDLLSRLKREALNNVVRVVLGFDSQGGGLLGGLGQVLGLGGGSAAAGSGAGGLGGLFNLGGGIGGLFGGVQGLLTGGGIAGTALGGPLAGLATGLGNLGLTGLQNGLLNNVVNASFGQLGLSALGGVAGSFAGNALGEGLFGKVAESNIGSTLGGIAGTIFGGPIGSAIGGAIGGLIDTAFGGDGKKRVTLGVATGEIIPKGVVDSVQADSGLTLTALARRADGDVAKQMLDQFASIDSTLTSITKAAGFNVDLSGRALGGGRNPGDQTAAGDFFGSVAFNKVVAGELEDAPAEFVQGWLDAVSTEFNGQLAGVVTSLSGDTEQIISDFSAALALDEIFSANERLFEDVDSLGETFSILTGEFRKSDEAIGDTLQRLDLATALMGAIGEETDTTVANLLRAQTTLDAVGTDAAANIVRAMAQLQGLQNALDVDQIEAYRKSQESIFNIWRTQSDAIAGFADNATEADLDLLGVAIADLGNTTAQVVGVIFDAKDQIADSFGGLIERIQFDLLGSEEARYNSLKAQADALAASINTLSDPEQILRTAQQIESITSRAYGLLEESQRQVLGEDFVGFLQDVQTSVDAQLDQALQQVQAQNDPNAPGSTANSVQAAFERLTDEMITRVNEAAAAQRAADEATAAQQQTAADQLAEAARRFGFWANGLPGSFNVNVEIPEVG